MPPNMKMPPNGKLPQLPAGMKPPPGMPANFSPQMLQEMLKNPEVMKLVNSPNFMTNMME